VQWEVKVIVTGGPINGSIVDESFYSISQEIADLDHWTGGVVERAGDGIVSKRDFTTYTGRKFGNEILDFYMKLPLQGWNGFTLRTANPNQSFTQGNSNYLVVLTEDRIELQKWVKGAREMLIGEFNEYTPRWGNLSNTHFGSNQKHRVQFGAINVAEGVRLVMYVDGIKIFDVVDTVDPFTEPGYFSLYSASSPITLSPVYSPQLTNVALGKNAALMTPDYSSYVFPQEGKGPENGNDGNLSTATQAMGTWDWSYIVDLGSKHSIQAMAVQFESDLYATSYEFNWLDQNGVWQTLVTLAGEGDKRHIYRLPTAIEAQYVGVKALSPNGPNQTGGQMSIKEFEVYGWIPVTSIILDGPVQALNIGDQYQISATVQPEASTDKRLAWRSSAPDVVRVDANGNLLAISAGSATITATSMDGSVSAVKQVQINIRADGNVAFQRPAKALHPSTYAELGYHAGSEPDKGVDGNPDTFAQATGSYAWLYAVDLGTAYNISRLEATFGSGYATAYEFVSSVDGQQWTVLHSGAGEANATRSFFLLASQGMRYVGIRAVKPDGPGQPGGQMTIAEFAAYDWGGEELVYPTAITFNTGDFTLQAAASKEIATTIAPANATLKTVIWSSSNPSVATVDASGRVKAWSTGVATITATAEMGGTTQSVNVTVVASQSGNLALLRPAYVYDLDGNALDTHPGRPATAGVDGDTGTVVQASGSYAWQYMVDLGQSHAIGSAAVTFDEGFASEYQWLGSVDGQQWTVLATRTDGDYRTRYVTEFPSGEAYRYIAIKALKPDGPNQAGGQMVIAELEVYAAEPPVVVNPQEDPSSNPSSPKPDNQKEQPKEDLEKQLEEKPARQHGSETDVPKITFSDIAGHWAQPYIEKAIKRGIVNGLPDGTFRPDGTMTRAMLATILNRVLVLQPFSSSWTVKDANEVPNWASGHLQALMEAGIVLGYPDGTVRANNQLTRTELIVVAVRALQLKLPEQPILPFADAETIPVWARPYVAAAYDAGLIQGVGGNRFAPDKLATRAEAVKLLLGIAERLMD